MVAADHWKADFLRLNRAQEVGKDSVAADFAVAGNFAGKDSVAADTGWADPYTAGNSAGKHIGSDTASAAGKPGFAAEQVK